MISFKAAIRALRDAILNPFAITKKLWRKSESKHAAKTASSKRELSELEYAVLTQAPLFQSELDRAISAAGKIRFNQTTNFNYPGLNHTKSKPNKARQGVYVNAGVVELSSGMAKVRDICVKSTNIQ